MGYIRFRDELYDFTKKLYSNLKDVVVQCSDFKEVSEVLDGEHINLTDYKKALKYKTISNIRSYTTDDENISKKVEEVNKITEDVEILPIKVEERKIYLKEDDTLVIGSEISNENKSKKTKIVVLTILVGAAIGGAVKRDIFDAIIAGLLGALAGFAIYEMTIAGDNNNFERVMKKDRIINKRLDKEYLNTLIDQRKNQVEKLFLDYIEKLNDIANN